MKEYEGKPDPKYGGIVTNVYKLPVGTTFYVMNGAWTGKICQDDISKFIKIEGCSPIRFDDKDESYLAIQPIKGIHYGMTNANNDEVVKVEMIKHCSVCKHYNSLLCKTCTIIADNASPNNFLADVSKITPFFVDSYYEILNKYIYLLKRNELEYELDSFNLGE